MSELIVTILSLGVLIFGFYLYWQSYGIKKSLRKREEEMKRKMYELAILKELGDRIGYSLNIQNIIDIITGSLNQFLKYSAVSYMLLEPEKIIFKVDLEKSVSRKFIDEIRGRMLKSLSALMERDFKKDQVEEVITGAILVEEVEEPVRSFFNIPLVIGDKVVGVLTIAHIEEGHYQEAEMTILYKITKQASLAVTKLQEVVKTEQGKLNSMVESIAEGVVMTDKDYRIMVANPAAKKFIGLEEKKEITIFDFIDNLEGKFDIRGKLEESVKLNKLLMANNILIGDRFFQIFVGPVKSTTGISEGEVLGGVVIFHDITHEKEVEKMREDFTSMMVHELRSPLDGIKKISELLKKDGVKKKKVAYLEYIQMIFKNSSEMLELVNDLLDAAKLESGKFEVFKQPANIKEVIENRIKFFETSAKDAKIHLSQIIAKDVPNIIEFDALRISQVLNNLISNALKFNKPEGTIAIQVFLHKKNEDIGEEAKKNGILWQLPADEKKQTDANDSLVIGVTDTGIGISSQNVGLLFNKFKQFQASALNKDHKGTGLGLVIAKGIVEAHGGTIGVVSKEGAGSSFYFTIPLNN